MSKELVWLHCESCGRVVVVPRQAGRLPKCNAVYATVQGPTAACDGQLAVISLKIEARPR